MPLGFVASSLGWSLTFDDEARGPPASSGRRTPRSPVTDGSAIRGSELRFDVGLQAVDLGPERQAHQQRSRATTPSYSRQRRPPRIDDLGRPDGGRSLGRDLAGLSWSTIVITDPRHDGERHRSAIVGGRRGRRWRGGGRHGRRRWRRRLADRQRNDLSRLEQRLRGRHLRDDLPVLGIADRADLDDLAAQQPHRGESIRRRSSDRAPTTSGTPTAGAPEETTPSIGVSRGRCCPAGGSVEMTAPCGTCASSVSGQLPQREARLTQPEGRALERKALEVGDGADRGTGRHLEHHLRATEHRVAGGRLLGDDQIPAGTSSLFDLCTTTSTPSLSSAFWAFFADVPTKFGQLHERRPRAHDEVHDRVAGRLLPPLPGSGVRRSHAWPGTTGRRTPRP